MRLEQGNTVEALFHSFRAFEGLIYKWVRWYYGQYPNIKFEQDRNSSLFISYTIHNKELPQDYITQLQEKRETQGKIYLYGNFLFELFKKTKIHWEGNEDIKIACEQTRKKRNSKFHQLLGMTEKDVFDAWETDNQGDWEARVLSCLNFVCDENFTSLKDASLMSQVHNELREVLKSYQP